MKIEIKNIRENPVNMLRRLGYIFQHKDDKKLSFIRPMASSGYPRFHIYTEIIEGDLLMNIHLDQKKGTYGKNTRHHGEYKNEGALEKEIERIKSFLE